MTPPCSVSRYAPAMKVDDNNDLAEATKLLEGKIRGPESLAHHKGTIVGDVLIDLNDMGVLCRCISVWVVIGNKS